MHNNSVENPSQISTDMNGKTPTRLLSNASVHGLKIHFNGPDHCQRHCRAKFPVNISTSSLLYVYFFKIRMSVRHSRVVLSHNTKHDVALFLPNLLYISGSQRVQTYAFPNFELKRCVMRYKIFMHLRLRQDEIFNAPDG